MITSSRFSCSIQYSVQSLNTFLEYLEGKLVVLALIVQSKIWRANKELYNPQNFSGESPTSSVVCFCHGLGCSFKNQIEFDPTELLGVYTANHMLALLLNCCSQPGIAKKGKCYWIMEQDSNCLGKTIRKLATNIVKSPIASLQDPKK